MSTWTSAGNLVFSFEFTACGGGGRRFWFDALEAHKTVDLQHAYLKVTRRTQRRIVEGLAAVRFAKTYVLIHPNSLALTVKLKREISFKLTDFDKGLIRMYVCAL